MTRIKDLPIEDRPREKALDHGVETLNVSELLALIIGSGVNGFSALEIAQKLLFDFHGLTNLFRAPYLSISEITGVSKARALSLCAAFELSKRLERIDYLESRERMNAEGVYKYYREAFIQERKESLHVLMFNKKGDIVKEQKIYQGTGKGLLLSHKEIVVELLLNYATGYILAHNHPSGNPVPSEEDIKRTLELAQESKELGITMLDHVVVGVEGYYSFKESRLL